MRNSEQRLQATDQPYFREGGRSVAAAAIALVKGRIRTARRSQGKQQAKDKNERGRDGQQIVTTRTAAAAGPTTGDRYPTAHRVYFHVVQKPNL